MIDRALTTLRSVSGVEGSFVIDNTGRLLGRDLSPLFSPEIVDSLAHRVITAFDATGQFLGAYEDLALKFFGRLVLLRKDNDLLVFVIAAPSTDIESLRFGCNLLLVQIRRALVSATGQAVPIAPAPIAPPQMRPQPFGRPPGQNPAQQRPLTRNPLPPNQKKPASDGIWG